jgi:hypothetical protein
MKAVLCPTCGKTALGPGTAKFPGGTPIVMGRFTSDGPLVVKCFRCKRSFKLDPVQFHRLPDVVDTTGSM